MKTSVIGFPRIGTLRELKFASEKYFRKEISEEQLKETAKELRKTHWNMQKNAGIDFISSNDFSFYDTVLDTAVLLNIIPKRYKELDLSEIDTYFAMARGYQGEHGDVKALAMKKWFNTNYHYIVPETEDDTKIKLSGDKLWNEYAEAYELGIETKPMLTGAYTMLKLCRYTGNKSEKDYVCDIIAAYKELLQTCGKKQIAWVQFDEPALVLDMDDSDKALFHQIYDELLAVDTDTKVLLQTYFGDIRDIYEEVIKMPFAGIGLDFIEGKQTCDLVSKYGFPKDKVLFAGVVNGKNIWKNHYDKTLKVLSGLRERGVDTVISTSCSLLHVPYPLGNEEKLSKEYTAYFSFAKEKLVELSELGKLADSKNYAEYEIFKKNHKLFSGSRDCTNKDVRNRLSKVSESDYVRLPKRSERQNIQKEEFKLPKFPTTTIGSFPQTKDVKANRSAFKRGEKTEQEYVDFNKKKIAECVKWQEEIGIDVLVHGEYERNDMVEYFGESLGGFLFTQKAWVQSYGTRCVKPPIIWGDVHRNKPITVEWSVYAQSLTKKIMKGMLTGPVTILNWSFQREDISIKDSISQIALAIRDECSTLKQTASKLYR